MKAPTDKRNDTIQIIVTTACDLFTCSNCTQLLPFRRDYRHMSVECFREAVRSVKDWPGVVGLFGGNPCAHPYFETLCEILEGEIPQQRRRGLWANSLRGHGRTVRRVFYPAGRFNLNAHGEAEAAAEIDAWLPGKLIKGSDRRASWHAGILLDRRDFGIPEKEWIAARENCDVNLNWSSAIAERDGKPYAYFCEIAASIDGIRGENHGVPALPGWWRRKMPAFEEQVRQCCDRGCGVPLRRLGHMDRDDVYDHTVSWVETVEKYRGKISLEMHGHIPEACAEATDYMRCRT